MLVKVTQTINMLIRFIINTMTINEYNTDHDDHDNFAVKGSASSNKSVLCKALKSLIKLLW